MNGKTLRNLTLQRKEYTGIGSRKTPPKVLRIIKMLGRTLAQEGLTLRSGAADGADSAFEEGCDEISGAKEIYLPWRNFNGNPSPLTKPSPMAEILAKKVHPRWSACSPAAKLLHSRNCHQILGESLKKPSAFVLFWAPETNGKIEGGTATAVQLAKSQGIDCFNLQNEEVFLSWKAFLEEYL